MRVVFCTTCKGRVQHLEKTLPRNIADNADYADCKFVVLDYCDPGPLRAYLWKHHRADMRSGRLVVYSYFGTSDSVKGNEAAILSNRVPPPDLPFHMAHAKNTAPRCAIREGADVLVTLDADNYTGPGFARFIADRFSGDASGIFLCPDFGMIRNLPHGPSRPARGFYGRLAIRAQDFIKLGGYDEIFSMWGGEDADMIARLLRLGYTKRFIDTCYLNTIPHSAEVRFREYPEARRYEDSAYIQELDLRRETVVNHGRFGLGTVYRNLDPAPVLIDPLPTRVFGIGLQRTATTSLDRAFRLLGLDSLHWGAGEAPLIWNEMNAAGRSVTLERFYALSDLPIPLLYENLDRAYPGSRFILTVRDERKWLRSVERLWDPAHNPDRCLWDVYPFSHRIHTALYGRGDFDPDTFLARYRRHNSEVREYFRDRSGDLLVMDMDGGAGWRELCGFLNLPAPRVSYPHASHMKIVEGKV